MDRGRSLSEDGQDPCISGVGAGKLHVIGELVRGNTLQDKLSCISVLAFITFERHVAQANADQSNKNNYQKNESVAPVARVLSCQSGLRDAHISFFSGLHTGKR